MWKFHECETRDNKNKELVWYIIEEQGQAWGWGTPLFPHWETTVAQQRSCSQSRVNNVRVAGEKKKGAKGRGRASEIDHGPWLEGTCWKSGGGATEERWGRVISGQQTAYSSTYSKPPSNNHFILIWNCVVFTQLMQSNTTSINHFSLVRIFYTICNLKLKKENKKASLFSVKSSKWSC